MLFKKYLSLVIVVFRLLTAQTQNLTDYISHTNNFMLNEKSYHISFTIKVFPDTESNELEEVKQGYSLKNDSNTYYYSDSVEILSVNNFSYCFDHNEKTILLKEGKINNFSMENFSKESYKDVEELYNIVKEESESIIKFKCLAKSKDQSYREIIYSFNKNSKMLSFMSVKAIYGNKSTRMEIELSTKTNISDYLEKFNTSLFLVDNNKTKFKGKLSNYKIIDLTFKK